MIKLQLYQVGNTSSRQITKFKQLGPQLARGWFQVLKGMRYEYGSQKYFEISAVPGAKNQCWGAGAGGAEII